MTLREAFEEFSNRKFIFVAPGGNKGDFMIYQGAFKIADELGLHYKHVLATLNWKAETYGKSDVIYLQGSGGFTSWWDWTPQVLKMLRKANPENNIIVGPSTVETDRRYLDDALNMDNEMTFFAREYTTFNVMRHYCDDVCIDHDTALHLRLGDGYLRQIVGSSKPRNVHDLLALREDSESLVQKTPRAGAVLRTGKPRSRPVTLYQHFPNEIRRKDFGVVCDPCRKENWACLHMNARRIVANRLHSAILGVILGKDTSIFAGSYHKNRSVWEYSLYEMGVKWIGCAASNQ